MMKRMMRFVCGFSILISPMVAYAQSYQSYGRSGTWTIVYNNIACYAMPQNTITPNLLVMMATPENRVILNFAKQGAWIKQGQEYYVDFELGQGLDFHGNAGGMVGPETGGNLLFPEFPNQYLDDFAKASKLTAHVKNGPQLPPISLQGSGKMLKLLRQCVKEKHL